MTDAQLKNVVVEVYKLTTQKVEIVERILNKKSFDADDRQVLNLYLRAGNQQRSIRTMKEEILRHIGYEGSGNCYGSTVSRNELEAMYNHIIGAGK
jgi:7-keto-8-aminopelargonate synthetase-like enzyme